MQSEEDHAVIQKITNASMDEMIYLMNTEYPKSWDISRPNLKYYIPVLNRIDDLFEAHITKYKLDKPITPLLEVDPADETLIVTLETYSHHLLEYSENRDVYESHDRLFQMLKSTSIKIKMATVKLICCVQERFLHHNPMKYSIPKETQAELLRIAKAFPPPIPLIAPAPVKIEVSAAAIDSPKKQKKQKKSVNKKQAPTFASLWDCFRPDYNVPHNWKHLNFEYYKTANSVIETKKIAKKKTSTSATSVKSEVVEGLHFFKINEETIKKLSYQQIYDKAMAVIPKNRWADFVFAVAIAKAYSSRSYESIQIRENFVILKCLTLACGNSQLTTAVFDDEPHLLNYINDLINLDNKIPRDIRLVAMRFLVNTSSKRTGASDLMRSLGGNVSHGLIFHILRTILKNIKEGTYDNDQRYLNYFYNILANMIENKTLAAALKTAGLIPLLFEFLKLKNDFRMTRSGPFFLIELLCQNLPESAEEFISNGGFKTLIDIMEYEVNFAIENPKYDGGAPNKPEFTHKITTRQVKLLTSLMKLVSTLIDTYSGDGVRNLYDSPIQKSWIKVLENPELFGHELVNVVIRVMTTIINSEPTSFSIFMESGLIQAFFDQFENLLLPNADLILDLTDAVNAVALNTEGQVKIIETKTIKKLISVLYRSEMCKVLCVNADVAHFGLAIDELGRHHPELKGVIDEEILHLIDTVPETIKFDKTQFFQSPLGSLYYSRDEEEIHNEEGAAELVRWDSSKQAEIIQCSLMFLSNLFENNKSWKPLFSKIDMHNLFKFITIENSPFDTSLSQSIYHFRNIIKAIDTTTSCYSLTSLCSVIKDKLGTVKDFTEFKDYDHSYFDQFDSCQVKPEFASQTLSNICSLNSLLYIFSEMYGKMRQPQKSSYILEKLSEHAGLDLIYELTAFFKRLAVEESILYHRTPTEVAGNAFTPVNSTSLKSIHVTAPSPKDPKFDGTSAKFKNISVIFFHASRIKFWLRTIFNALVLSPEKRSDARALGMTPTHFVTVCHNLANFFCSLFKDVEFEDLEIQTSYLLMVTNQIHELMSQKMNGTTNVQGIISICVLQNPDFPMFREKIFEYFTLVSTLNANHIQHWANESYTSVELPSSSITLLDVLLKIHYDLDLWNDYTNAQFVTNRVYADIPTKDGIDYNKEVIFSLQFSVGVLNFLIYQQLFSTDHLDILNTMADKIPKKLTNSLIEIGRVAFKSPFFVKLIYGGKLYQISGSTTCPSDDKIDYLISLGLTRDHAGELLFLTNGSLELDDENLEELVDHFTDGDIDFDDFIDRFKETPYVPKEPNAIQICTENDIITIDTLDDLSFHRGANEKSFIDTCIRFAEIQPDLTSNILNMCDSVFVDDSIDNVLTTAFETLKSFDFLNKDEFIQKSFGGILALIGHLILRMRNRKNYFNKLDEIMDFIISLIIDNSAEFHWFVSALNVCSSVLSVSKAPYPSDCKVTYPNRLARNMSEIPDMYVMKYELEERFRNYVLNLNQLESESLVLSCCKSILLLTVDVKGESVLGNSPVIKALMKYMSSHKTDQRVFNHVINVIRRSVENETVLRNYISNEVDKVLASRKKLGVSSEKDLELIVSEISPYALRNSELLVEYLSKDTILVKGLEKIKSTEIRRMTEEQKMILEQKTTKDTDKDVNMSQMTDQSEDKDIEMKDATPLQKPYCGIMHFLLSELMELTKLDLTIDERTAEEKEKEGKDQENTKELQLKDLLDRNKNLQYSVFLMQTIAELLFCYNEAKTSFLTFSKKSKGQDSTTPKPRSTALNMLIHRFIVINPFEQDNHPESSVKLLLSNLASSCILCLNSSVPIEGLDFSDVKITTPDLTFARKFVADILIKVIKEAEISNKNSLVRYGKIMDIINLVNCLVSRDFHKMVYITMDSVLMKHDKYHLAKELLDKNFTKLITDVLATLDVNFPYTDEFSSSLLKCLTRFGKIKVDYQNEFRQDTNTNEADEEVYEEDDELDEDTPNLLRNSTLGMYDIDEIEDEGINSDFVDEFLDDEDIEVVVDDDDDEIGSDIDSSGGESGDQDDNSDNESAVDDDNDSIIEIDDVDISEGDEDSHEFMDADDAEDAMIYASAEESSSNEDGDDDDSVSQSDFDDMSDDMIDELLDEHYVVDLVTDSEQDDSMSGEDGEENENDEDDDHEDGGQPSDDDSIILDQWLENHEMEQARRRRRSRSGRRASRNSMFDGEDDDRIALGSMNIRPLVVPDISRMQSVPMAQVMRELPAFIDEADNMINYRGENSLDGMEQFSNLRRLLNPFIHKKSNNPLNVVNIKTTTQRWSECSKMFNSLGYAMRTVPIIINRLYERSRIIYDEESSAKQAIKQKKMLAMMEKRLERKALAEERARERAEERENARNATQDLEPIMVEIGGRDVDISGTGIDPEFLLALPEEMREEVYAQHLHDSGNVDEDSDEDEDIDDFGNIDADDMDEEEDDDDGDEDDEEDDDGNSSRLGNPFRTSMSRLTPFLRAETGNTGLFIGENNEEAIADETTNTVNDEPKKINRLYFTSMVEKSSIASLLKIVFVPQVYTKREIFFQAVSYLCLNKQNRSDLISILLYILQEGLNDQVSLQNVYHQVCLRAYCLLNPKFRRGDQLPQWANFPVNSNPLVVATQAIDILQYLMENETTMRIHMLTEQDGLSFMKKSKKSFKKDKSYKYPINILLNLLDNKLIKNDANLMDILSRTIQICSKPLIAMKQKLDENDLKFKNLIQLPVIHDKNLKQIIGILVSDDCPNKVFQQAIVSMQNLSVLENAKNVFPKDLSKRAMQLSSKISRELKDLIKDLKNTSSNQNDDEIPSLNNFVNGSSDQTKLLRVLTALDYLYQDDDIQQNNIEELKDLYKNSSLGYLWGVLSDCLKLLKDDESKNYIAFILSPMIESLMVVCKHSKVEKMNSIDLLKYEAIDDEDNDGEIDFMNEPVENLFFKFTKEHKKILNHMIRNNSKLMSGPFSVLIKNPKVLEFDNKRVYFEERLHKDDPEDLSKQPKLEVKVNRDQVFLDTYRTLYFKPIEQVKKSRLDINFKGEEGVDAGGVTREWYQVLARQMFDPNYALFTPVSSDKSTFQPNRTSWVNPEHLSFFKFVGMIIGKAVNDGYMLDCHFSKAVFKSILGKSVNLKDMESMDLDYYKSLVWMLENDITDIIVETFSVETDDYGEHKIIELKPDGENIPVTEENKQEYVKLIVEYRLIKSVKNQMDKFLEGFFSIIPQNLIKIFDEQELELLVSGMPDIDVDDWKNNTIYENYSPSSKQIQWFWRCVKSFDLEERAKLLQFSTGTSKVPLGGFKELPGMNGVNKFSIHRVYNSTDRLPTAHTCFNQIDLPEYESYSKLRNALSLAIREGYEGFGFA